MNRDLYSNFEFTELKNRLNQEILRRGTFKWWDPLTTPSVGVDRTSLLSLPDIGDRITVDENTYTINNPSTGSIEPTRNIKYPAHGENPAGQNPIKTENLPNTSAAQFNADELRNMLVGLAKIQDVNLFYGRDEISNIAFRDPQGIEDAVNAASNSELNALLGESDISPTRNDPNGGVKYQKNVLYPVKNFTVTYPIEGGSYVMPSGEFDGEEVKQFEGLGPDNFYDDYGAQPGDANYHPMNRFTSEQVRRDWEDQDHNRNPNTTIKVEGGIPSATRFGLNPRNPEQGDQYASRPVYGGKIGSCNVACFKAGTLIETDKGPVPIENINIGDMVLTQSNEYHVVYQNSRRECDNELIAIRATGAPIIYTTYEHPFWVKRYIGLGRKDGKFQQLYSEPEWVEAKDIKSRDKLCLINRQFGKTHIDPGVAYMVGRWLGDGWIENCTTKAGNITRRYVICCAFNERYELEEKLVESGILFSIPDSDKLTCQKYHILHGNNENINNKIFMDIVDKCGKYAYGKYLDQSIYGWDEESIRNLLQGYVDSDGDSDLIDRHRIRVTTVSKKLAYGISILMRMIGRNPSWSERSYQLGKGFIQGREVKMRNSYTLAMFTGEYSRHYSEYDYDNNIVWASVTLVQIPEFRYDVYNLSVEDDHTFYADGVLVHNCTGLCYQTCDNQCSESCSTTCWNRCGEACTSSCGNICTGCSTMCYSSCKTKCENVTGYACVKSGAKTVKITTTGGKNGQPAKNTLEYTIHTCQGCSYSCQFYPNKKTECWDAGCMGKCFISCSNSCSISCYGGCIDNEASKESDTTYRTGKGRGCSGGCTLNCIGFCSGVCTGYCIQTCWHACKATCTDNCSWECSTNCGSGCADGCTKGCSGCANNCDGDCKGSNGAHTCTGCGFTGGCTSTCRMDCNFNCVGSGCRSVCGTDAAGACEANCRLNCSGTSCTSMCSDACDDQCTTCVNTCGFQCGACTSTCSTSCGAACNINCTESCANNCSENCVHSCSEECGGCSNLCYSCVGMCIGVCSVKCENGCSSCANMCGWWCDSSCNRACFANCSLLCITNCSGSCSTFLTSDTIMTTGPERKPTADGYIYPNPKNRWEERESFKLIKDITPTLPKAPVVKDTPVVVSMFSNKYYIVVELPIGEVVENVQRVREINSREGVFRTNLGSINTNSITHIWKYNAGIFEEVDLHQVFVNDFIYVWDTINLGEFPHNDTSYINEDRTLVVSKPAELKYTVMQTTISGGVYTIDETTGEVLLNYDMLSGVVESNQSNVNEGGGVFIILFHNANELSITGNDIEFILPFGFQVTDIINHDKDGNLVVIIKRDEFLFPEDPEAKEALKNG